MTKTIEYFYACHSVYAYFGAWELARIAQAAGARVIHRPYDFNPVLASVGASPFPTRSKQHMDYFFGRELVRWSEFRDRPFIRARPIHHDNPVAPGNQMIIAAQTAGLDADALSRAILQAHWQEDADHADPATLIALADGLGMNGTHLFAAAQQDAAQREHAANTQAAIDASVFGSPTYFVQGDMFYGQDRLDHVARALIKPFAR